MRKKVGITSEKKENVKKFANPFGASNISVKLMDFVKLGPTFWCKSLG